MNATLGPVTPGCRERLTAHYGYAVSYWLEQLPEILEAAARSWGLLLLGYHDAGHASALALAASGTGEKAIMKAWFDHSRYRHETAALRHWEPINGRVVRTQDDSLAVACLELVGGSLEGHARPADDEARVANAVARLHSQRLPSQAFPKLAFYLNESVEPRVLGRLRRNQKPQIAQYAELALKTVPLSTTFDPALLHGDLYQENVLWEDERVPRLIDPLPMIGDPAFDWALFTVYYDLARDPAARLRLAAEVSGTPVKALLPWCLGMCLDGLLYYEESGDDRASRMREIMTILAAA